MAAEPLNLTNTRSLLSAQDAVAVLVACNGNAELAAARAGRALGKDISKELLLAAIASDPTSMALMQQQFKLLTMLQAFDAFRLIHKQFTEKIPDLSAKDSAKAYSDMLNQINGLTSGPAPQMPDPFSTIMRTLPPEVAAAVDFFMKHPRDASAEAAAKSGTPEPPRVQRASDAKIIELRPSSTEPSNDY